MAEMAGWWDDYFWGAMVVLKVFAVSLVMAVALGLIGDPELIFLDEPTTGFDPAARRRSWALVENLTSLGRTVVLTTHYLDEAEYLADRVIVLAEGRMVAEGTPAELRAAEIGRASCRERV